MEKEESYGTINFYNYITNEHLLEYERKSPLEFLKLIKETNSFIFESKDGDILECIFVKSIFNLAEDVDFFSENIDLYFTVNKINQF